MLGNSGVGKSSILSRYTDNKFPLNLMGTAGIDFKHKYIELDSKAIKLEIFDTAGQERYHCITTNYYQGVMGILLVYDVSDPSSFQDVYKWMDQIRNNVGEDVIIALLGNKIDKRKLASLSSCSAEEGGRKRRNSKQEEGWEHGRGIFEGLPSAMQMERMVRGEDGGGIIKEGGLVRKDEGEGLARKYGVLFGETSAKDGDNVVEIFEELIRGVMKEENILKKYFENEKKMGGGKEGGEGQVNVKNFESRKLLGEGGSNPCRKCCF